MLPVLISAKIDIWKEIYVIVLRLYIFLESKREFQFFQLVDAGSLPAAAAAA
jgi:hypothetical protein